LERDFPEKVRAITRFDQQLSRRMYASADMILMPSRYEPCGLAQMIGMRYGCVPIARATGGLFDTIKDIDNDPNGTGFLFSDATSEDLSRAIKRAFSIFQKKEDWSELQVRCMSQDFSWKQSAKAYLKVYLDLHTQKHD